MNSPSKISWRHTVIGIIDDNGDWRRTVRAMCLSFGATEVVEASDAADFLKTTESAGYAFDLLLVDDEMQPMDGFMMVRSLREMVDHPSRRATAILMAGHSDVTILRKALNAGFHGVLPKPFSAQVLGDRVERVLTMPMVWKEDKGFLHPVLAKPGQG